MDVSSDHKNPMDKDELFETHDPLSDDHLTAIENGGIAGLERIVGAVLEIGSQRLRVLCAEVYNRDPLEDPHAESQSASTTSIPTDGPATQYQGRLKITRMPDRYNKKLVIGVRSHNYLITSGEYGQDALVGPGRCAKFPPNHTTKLYFKKKTQDSGLLSNDILGIARVRSGFGHLTAYTPRRGALQGFASISVMPITIFTLSQHSVPLSRVFRELAIRARKRKSAKIILRISDIQVPKQDDSTKAAEITRKLVRLFLNRNKLVITGNSEAEKVLTELASEFSSAISDKNLRVAGKILSGIHGAD
ncbi:hypothetical protein EDD21DRAFT_205103 [Dissophora ornata]|nr:hypothetical protein EDD21DRAFT_205103 [Dissophora ornata]